MTVISASEPLKRRQNHPGTRVFFFHGLALLVTGAVALLFADLLWRRGWTAGSSILMLLFVVLMFFNTAGALHGVYGFFIRRFGDRQRVTELNDWRSRDIAGTSTAILFPIYNEDAGEVCARLKATYLSLEKTGLLGHFDFHILSDSTGPANWVDEETRWLELVRSLDAFGRIFYRRRVWNEGKKSGNVRDFLNTLGNRYRYFVVFDADSYMTGQTLASLVKLMEANPRVGLIQTPPAPINSSSLFGRLHQFASRLYGPLFATGSNYWVQGLGNYIGHNAIVRTEPFMKYCDLPHLPGKKPFGGQILSHDFVEAALLVRNHWQVWQAYDLEESYEEVPQGLIEYAQRDRRWCQGNLQHLLVLPARGIRGVSRMHFAFGIFGYLSGPLWLLFLLAFNMQAYFSKSTGLSQIPVRPQTPFLNISLTQHALLVFALSTLVLLAPKIFALLELLRDRERARAFGGAGRAWLSAFLELLYSTLQAPVLMLWHTQFVISILLGRSVSWGKQNRLADGTSWSYAGSQLWKHTAIGLLWGFLVWRADPALLGWFIPVLLGMVLSIPLTVWTSRASVGQAARRAGLFVTPEEISPTGDVLRLRALLSEKGGHDAFVPDVEPEEAVIADPRLNALHLWLLERDQRNPIAASGLRSLSRNQKPVSELRDKAARDGLSALTEKEKLLVLSDAAAVAWLHRRHWAQPAASAH